MNATTDAIHIACTAQTAVTTPLGRVLLARTAVGLAGLWFEGQRHHPQPFGADVRPNDALLMCAAAQLQAYFAGDRRDFDVPLDLHGSPFQRSVWHAMRGIPFGRTLGYGAIAAGIGAPAAVRAVGAAVGRNPLSVILPCHRVVASSGALTGYAGGLDRKWALLRIEGHADVGHSPQRTAAEKTTPRTWL